jgi:DNA modification methylase
MPIRVIQGDCIGVLGGFDDNTFDSVVTDPPYNLSFMGKGWDTFGGDYQTWCEQWARECLRVLKPGGYLLAFGGTRTYHRLACAIEDAGFEIRDSLHWIYGSGFPKSHDVSKAIDREAGAERQVIGHSPIHSRGANTAFPKRVGESSVEESGGTTPQDKPVITAPATAAAETWAGWGTALKPAHEPIVMARKPLTKGHTVAANVLDYGTGGINIDGCRIPTTDSWKASGNKSATGVSYQGSVDGSLNISVSSTHEAGRWPPNVLLTHSPDCEPIGMCTVRTEDRSRPPRTPNAIYGGGNGTNLTASGTSPVSDAETVEAWDCAEGCPVQEMDRQSGKVGNSSGGIVTSGTRALRETPIYKSRGATRYAPAGGSSRFFPVFRYCAKAGKKERPVVDGMPGHPTVKPVALMQWLVRLVTPPGGYVVDPFAGSGTTAEACLLEGFDCLLIERDTDSIQRIKKRMSKYETEAA